MIIYTEKEYEELIKERYTKEYIEDHKKVFDFRVLRKFDIILLGLNEIFTSILPVHIQSINTSLIENTGCSSIQKINYTFKTNKEYDLYVYFTETNSDIYSHVVNVSLHNGANILFYKSIIINTDIPINEDKKDCYINAISLFKNFIIRELLPFLKA